MPLKLKLSPPVNSDMPFVDKFSCLFIEPEVTNTQTRELQNLEFEESDEIKKILSQLTDFFRPYLPYLELQYRFLLNIDLIHAKSRYAEEIGGILPEIIKDQMKIVYKNAFHPLLLQAQNDPRPIRSAPALGRGGLCCA